MGNRNGHKEIEEDIKESLQNNDQTSAVKKIQEYIEKDKKVVLNIAVTGESGSGKSTFVNAMRGIKDGDEGAAPTGAIETTTSAKAYPHPEFPNVTLWDLPGMGTSKFPAAKYLRTVKLKRFDFFIIISSDRFRENDVKLAKEIRKQRKRFYFVRSKIDHSVKDQRRSKKINEESTLSEIRNDCIQGLKALGEKSPQVFLISSFELHLYDFHLLEETLEKELPDHKKDALLFSMPNISVEMINKKKKAFHSKVKFFAALSAGVATVLIPGLSIAVDVGVLVGAVNQYVHGFGLDVASLQKLADRVGLPYEELTKVIQSPLAASEINSELITKALVEYSNIAVLKAAGEGCKFIPVFGIPLAMTLSFVTTFQLLSQILNKLEEDACRVFNRVMDSNTEE